MTSAAFRRRQKSAHWVMCEAIARYLTSEEALESFKHKALASWAQYQRKKAEEGEGKRGQDQTLLQTYNRNFRPRGAVSSSLMITPISKEPRN
jgi:hypothetical protein